MTAPSRVTTTPALIYFDADEDGVLDHDDEQLESLLGQAQSSRP